MKNLFVLAVVLSLTTFIHAQHSDTLSDEALAQMAIAEGMDSVEIPGYIYFHRHGVHGPTQEMVDVPFRYEPPTNEIPLFIANPGFEAGNFTNWNGAIGDNNVNSSGPLQSIAPGIYNGAINPTITNQYARHSLMQAPGAGIDPIGNFPIVPWGYGTYVARLGNSYAQYEGQFIEQTWVVGPADTALILSYAVVTTFGHHTLGQEAYFQIDITDGSNALIYYRHDEHGALPATYDSAATDVYYLPWESDTLDLSAYIGQTLKIRFTTAGCIWSGHYCYAYVDCNPLVNVGINEHSEQNLRVYPNPSVDGIFSVVCTSTTQEVPIVYDLSGRVVDAIITHVAEGWIIDISQTQSGVYTVEVGTTEGVTRCSLIH